MAQNDKNRFAILIILRHLHRALHGANGGIEFMLYQFTKVRLHFYSNESFA